MRLGLKQKLSSLSLASKPRTDVVDARENDKLDEVMRRIICQAGVDYETRPMVVVTASQLPDPGEISYDMLLARMLSYLDLYVENDYTVVFLAAGGRHTPGWNWVWKAYRSLGRAYRKNLKRVYVVHSTWFSKMLFSLAGAIISPKFFRKIQYIRTLSALAQFVPLTQIDISPSVYQENLKYERQITLPDAQRGVSHAFGVSLDELMGEYGETSGIPRVIKDCVEFLRSNGMEVEGLFRRSPNSILLRQAKEAYDRGQPVSLPSFGDPHIPAVLLKKFFRDLPFPIFPESLYPTIRRCPAPPTNQADLSCIDYIRNILFPQVAQSSPAAVIVLPFVLHLLHDVSLHCASNKMDASNLALCFAPNLVSSSSIMEDTQICAVPATPTAENTTLGTVIRICIAQYYEIFEELPDRTTAKMIPVTQSSLSTTSPPTVKEGTSPLDDDDSDDALLVMAIGPSQPSVSSALASSSSWTQRNGIGSPSAWASRKDSSSTRYPSLTSLSSSPRSIINIDKTMVANMKHGSIRIGHGANSAGTMRRGSTAGVETVGITAAGFFTTPT